MDKEIEGLGLSMMLYNVLLTSGLITVGDIMNYGLESIIILKGCGKLCHQERKEKVLKDLPKE